MKRNTKTVTADVAALLRSRHTLLWIVSREEERVERALLDVAAETRYAIRCWDCAGGIQELSGGQIDPQRREPQGALAWVGDRTDRCIYILRDMDAWTQDPATARSLKSLARRLQTLPPDQARTLVVLTASAEIPPSLRGVATLVEWPLPDRDEVARLLSDVVEAQPPQVREKLSPNGERDAAVDAAMGMSATQAANAFALSLVSSRRIDPVRIANDKRRIVSGEAGLEWHDPEPRGLSAVGGLDLAKPWLVQRRSAFTAEAREYGLPAPRGVLLVGVPGCGKSLLAKAVATAWAMPLLRLDMGGLKSKYVGDSEQNIRRALAVAETVSPCVLWIDEIEKALAGSTGPAGDGGVSADALGAVLSWLQERVGSVFVVATANEVRALPPELLRKGRFDEVFWVDLPTRAERCEIVCAALSEHRRKPDAVDLDAVADATADFSGAEIAALVPEAMYAAFADDAREIRTADLLAAATTVTPLAKTSEEKIAELRKWAKGRTRPASSAAPMAADVMAGIGARALDFGGGA
jgi:hypothetical protein